MVQAAIVTIVGLRVARILVFPLAFLLFAVPAGEVLVPTLIQWTADFTVGALRGVETGCLLTVSDIVVEGVFTRISDEELRASVDRMTKIALEVAIEA